MLNQYYVMVKDEKRSKHYNLLVEAISYKDAERRVLKKVADAHNHGKIKGLKVFNSMLYK